MNRANIYLPAWYRKKSEALFPQSENQFHSELYWDACQDLWYHYKELRVVNNTKSCTSLQIIRKIKKLCHNIYTNIQQYIPQPQNWAFHLQVQHSTIAVAAEHNQCDWCSSKQKCKHWNSHNDYRFHAAYRVHLWLVCVVKIHLKSHLQDKIEERNLI